MEIRGGLSELMVKRLFNLSLQIFFSFSLSHSKGDSLKWECNWLPPLHSFWHLLSKFFNEDQRLWRSSIFFSTGNPAECEFSIHKAICLKRSLSILGNLLTKPLIIVTFLFLRINQDNKYCFSSQVCLLTTIDQKMSIG